MSVPQGSVSFNEGYGDEVVVRVSLAQSCGELQRIGAQSLFSLQGTYAAIQSQYAEIGAALTRVTTDAENLFNHIATFAGLQAATGVLSIQLGTAPAITPDFGSILAYLNLQASAMLTVNSTGLLQLAQFLIQLNGDYTTLQADIATLNARISTMEHQLVRLPEQITQIENALAGAVERFPNCVLPSP